MGMYTELYLGVELSKDMPKEIVDYFRRASVHDDVVLPTEIADKDRLNYIGGMGSYYFDAQPFIDFRYDEISSGYFLTTVFNLKNYDGEIQALLKMINPYIKTRGHYGHVRYEEDDLPTILMKER